MELSSKKLEMIQLTVEFWLYICRIFIPLFALPSDTRTILNAFIKRILNWYFKILLNHLMKNWFSPGDASNMDYSKLTLLQCIENLKALLIFPLCKLLFHINTAIIGNKRSGSNCYSNINWVAYAKEYKGIFRSFRQWGSPQIESCTL